jgi:hypothetical protein
MAADDGFTAYQPDDAVFGGVISRETVAANTERRAQAV